MKILLVEDEAGLAEFIRMELELELEGNSVAVAETLASAGAHLNQSTFDAILLDAMLPDGNGFQFCREVRQKLHIPILILTARGAVTDRVEGLDAGADDYLVKPFAIEELMARLRAVMRRKSSDLSSAHSFTIGDLEVLPEERRVVRQGMPVELTVREYELLLYMLRHQGQPLTRHELLHHVWGYQSAVDTNVVDVYVGYLRQKLDPHKKHIHTVRGIGFVFRGDDG